MSLPHGAVGWCTVCDYGISQSYSLYLLFGVSITKCINNELMTKLKRKNKKINRIVK